MDKSKDKKATREWIDKLKRKLNTLRRTGNFTHWMQVQWAYQELHDTIHPYPEPTEYQKGELK